MIFLRPRAGAHVVLRIASIGADIARSAHANIVLLSSVCVCV